MSDPIFFEHFRELARQSRSPVAPPSDGGAIKKQQSFFQRAVSISLISHGSLLLVVVVAPIVASLFGISTDYTERFNKKEMKNAIRVDLVGLPELTLQELQSVDPTQDVGLADKAAPPVPVEEAPPAPSETAMKLPTKDQSLALGSKQEAQQKAAEVQKKRLEDLRASLRVEQRRKEILKELKGGDTAGTGTGRTPLAGNIVSDGYSVTGDVATDTDIFHGFLKAHQRKTWNLPGWMEASKLSVRVLVKLGPTGKVLSSEFLKKSGNDEFDRYVSQAIREAEPYPAPPSTLQRQVMEQGVEWGFPQ